MPKEITNDGNGDFRRQSFGRGGELGADLHLRFLGGEFAESVGEIVSRFLAISDEANDPPA